MPEVPPPGSTPTGYQRTQGGGVAWSPPSAEHLGTLLPQYEVECLLGRGGMGAVYKGMQKSLERPVAIKILPPDLDDADASYTQRFKNEARLMARMNHPAIVHVYDYGETSEGQFYFVMEFVNGTDVQQMIQSQGRLPPEHALAITAHVCDALRYAHEHGVIHRDIKPANVLINMEGAVKVADFGLAKSHDGATTGITKTGLAMGTPDYVAPEALVMGVDVDARADVYAVGVMLYAMLTGFVPRGAFKPPSVVVPGVDRRFDSIVEKAMQMDRDERYPSAAHIRRDLDVILTTPQVQSGGQSSAAVPKQSLPQKPAAKGPRKPMGKSANVPVRKGDAPPAAAAAPNPQSQIPTPKSKAPLFIGIGAVAAIAVGAFVMMGGGDKAKQSGPLSPLSGTSVPSASDSAQGTVRTTLPATPIKVREEPKPAVAAPISNSKSSISNAAPAAFPPGKWVKVFTKFEDLPEELRKAGVKFEDGWIKTAGKTEKSWLPLAAAQPVTNFAMRFSCQHVAGGFALNPAIRKDRRVGEEYQMRFLKEQNAAILSVFNTGKVRHRDLAKTPLIQQPDGTTSVVELAAIGKHIFGRYEGTLIGPIQDQTLAQGLAYIAFDSPIRDIEVINLDGLPEAEALKILGVDEKGNDLRGADWQAVAEVARLPTDALQPRAPHRRTAEFPPGLRNWRVPLRAAPPPLHLHLRHRPRQSQIPNPAFQMPPQRPSRPASG